MTTARQKLGRKGEEMAAQLLVERGYKILQCNYRCPEGEMDIIARDGDYTVFVEVRTRRGQEFGTPEESITPAKKARLARVAQSYLQEHALHDADWRIDLVAIEMSAQGQLLRQEIIPNAVTG
jgi:putative endonuclease